MEYPQIQKAFPIIPAKCKMGIQQTQQEEEVVTITMTKQQAKQLRSDLSDVELSRMHKSVKVICDLLTLTVRDEDDPNLIILDSPKK